jgi:hypothetical protein
METVSLKELGIKPKLVLYCFLSPQYDTISVSLTNSQPLFSRIRGTATVKYAMVEISTDNKNWTQIPYDENSKHYLLPQSQFPVVEGQTYYIRASAPDYEDISASCTVPFWREIGIMPDGITATSPQNGVSSAILSLSWKDYQGEENYYAFIQYDFYVSYNHEWDNINQVWVYSDTTVSLDTYMWDNSGVVFSDQGKDGEKMSLSATMWREGFDTEWITSEDNQQYDSVYIIAMQTDRNTFLYENSARAAMDADGMTSIFTIEPTLVYSNIKNGYGVFGAMTFKSYLLNFRKKTIVETECMKRR